MGGRALTHGSQSNDNMAMLLELQQLRGQVEEYKRRQSTGQNNDFAITHGLVLDRNAARQEVNELRRELNATRTEAEGLLSARDERIRTAEAERDFAIASSRVFQAEHERAVAGLDEGERDNIKVVLERVKAERDQAETERDEAKAAEQKASDNINDVIAQRDHALFERDEALEKLAAIEGADEVGELNAKLKTAEEKLDEAHRELADLNEAKGKEIQVMGKEQSEVKDAEIAALRQHINDMIYESGNRDVVWNAAVLRAQNLIEYSKRLSQNQIDRLADTVIQQMKEVEDYKREMDNAKRYIETCEQTVESLREQRVDAREEGSALRGNRAHATRPRARSRRLSSLGRRASNPSLANISEDDSNNAEGAGDESTDESRKDSSASASSYVSSGMIPFPAY